MEREEVRLSQVKKQPVFKPTHVSAFDSPSFLILTRVHYFCRFILSDLFRYHDKTFISFTVLAFESVWCDNKTPRKYLIYVQ